MSALLAPRRPRRGTSRDADEQALPYGAPSAAPEVAARPGQERAASPAAPPEPSTTASARRQGPTLDDLVAGAWEGLLAGAPAECLACGTAMTPRYSAGAGVVGGRCGGCGSTLT